MTRVRNHGTDPSGGRQEPKLETRFPIIHVHLFFALSVVNWFLCALCLWLNPFLYRPLRGVQPWTTKIPGEECEIVVSMLGNR